MSLPVVFRRVARAEFDNAATGTSNAGLGSGL